MYFISVSDQCCRNEEFTINVIKLEDDLKKEAKKFENLDTQAGELLHKFDVLGNTCASKIWVAIVVFHEYAYLDKIILGKSEPELSTFIFAETLEEAKKLLKKHPAYLKDIEEIKNCEDIFSDGIDDMDVVDYILGLNDYGGQFAQCLGGFGEVPEKWHSIIRSTMVNR
jgi:hypothetical protein